MQDHRTGGEFQELAANPPPPIDVVHGLGESHALRVDLQPVQVPWLADEVDTLRAILAEELSLARVRQSGEQPVLGAGADGDDVDRRGYQLRVLKMIRRQLPLSPAVVEACVASPWEENERALEAVRITSAVTVVGPARAMLVLIRGAARHVVDALAEAMAGPRDVGTAPTNPLGHWPELTRLTPAVRNRLKDMSGAVDAFVNVYAAAVAQQGYSFDPEHYPVFPDELW